MQSAVWICLLLAAYAFSQTVAAGPGGSAPNATRPVASSESPVSPELRIGSGDVLDVKVYSTLGTPDIAQTLRVSNTGQISLPLVGNVAVAGLTADQAEVSIERKYKEGQFLKNPQVSIFVSQYATQGISVLGEVAKPGIYPATGARTVADVLSVAGGLAPGAGNTVLVTHRAPHGQQISVPLSPDGTPQQNVPILPGDTVVVSKSGVVYVVGEVGKPGGFPVNAREQLTVLAAIALAEGTKPDAALDGARLIRKSGANFSEVQIPLKKILTGKSSDLQLQAGDIVFVPHSAAKGAARRSLEAIVQTATGLAIYRP